MVRACVQARTLRGLSPRGVTAAKMGLDLLDITFRIEKTLGVSLSEDDFRELVRDRDVMVGDLYDLVLKKLHLRDVARYDLRLNYALWAELQGVIHTVTKVPLERVELQTPLESLFPQKTRRAAWETFRDACPYRVRSLDYPSVVRVFGFSLAVSMVLIEQFQIWQVPGLMWLWPLLGLFGMWMLIETYAKVLRLLAPFRNRFPSGMATVKDLCRAVLARNYEDVCHACYDTAIPLDERSLAVWKQLTGILVDALGVDADEVTFRSRLFRDLGAA